MNTLRFYPKSLKKIYIKNLRNSGITAEDPEKYHKLTLTISLAITLAFSTIFFLFGVNLLYSFLVFFLSNVFAFWRVSLKATTRIKKMETVFPDVISLMASNLRSGVTIDRAFLISARPEFKPLDKEIISAGREISTGKNITYALRKMAEKIDSEKISKIISLIISGIQAGGNMSDLLDQTARNMKEKEILEKKAASTVNMYVIFIFFAVAVGAPVLFGLSSILVEVVISLTERIPDVGTQDLPFTFGQISISVNFIVYFSIFFIIVTDLISSFMIGMVQKGEGKVGLKSFFPLVIIGLSIFFAIRIFLSKILLETVTGF